MNIVGFSGYARSGKDSAAEALLSLGFRRISFADKLRDFLYAFDPIIESYDEFGRVARSTVKTVIDIYGWSGYKETEWSEDIRRNLQILGTECGRKIVGDDIWVNATLDNLSDGNYAIADVRFPNEADAIRSRGGRVLRIIRDGVGPANEHESETALDSYRFDGVIHNSGTKEDFETTVRGFYAYWS